MKYTKIAFFLAVAIVLTVIAPANTFALTVGDNGTSATTVSAPATQDNGTGAGTITTPATQDNGTGAASITTPATQDNGTGAGTIKVPATQDNGTGAGTIKVPATQDNGTGAGTTPITTPATQDNGTGAGTDTSTTPPANTGGSTVTNTGGGPNIGFGGGGFGGFGGGSAGGSSLPILTSISQCDYLTQYLKVGTANDSVEVTKLQNFLKNNEGMSIAITGVFDQATFDAVEAFQAKYVADVMLPWGVTTPTGQVYYTTTKKINELYCKATFALTPAQVAEIEAYRTSIKNGTAPTSGGDVGLNGTPAGTSTAPGTDLANGSTSPENSQVGAAAGTSIIAKIWAFIKRLFGR